MADETTEELNGRAGKPRSRAGLNLSAIDLIPRHVGRIQRLRESIVKATDREQPERLASLHNELERRLAELSEARLLLDGV